MYVEGLWASYPAPPVPCVATACHVRPPSAWPLQ